MNKAKPNSEVTYMKAHSVKLSAALLAFATAVLTAQASIANTPSDQGRPLQQLEGNSPALSRVQGEERFRVTMLSNIAAFDALNSISPKFREIVTSIRDNDAASSVSAVAAAHFHVLTSAPGVDHALLKKQYDSAIALEKDERLRLAGINLGKRVALSVLSWDAGRIPSQRTLPTFLSSACTGNLQSENRVTASCFSLLNAVLRQPADQYHAASPDLIPKGPGYHIPSQVSNRTPSARILLSAPLIVPENAFDSLEPLEYDSSMATSEIRDAMELGGRESLRRTSEQTAVALFWNSGQAMDEMQLFRQILARKTRDAVDEARILALASIAAHDTFYHVMRAKVRYQRWRPEAAIAGDHSLSGVRNRFWKSLVHASGDAEFPSGLAALTATQFSLLKNFFEADGRPLSWRNSSLNMTREWSSLDQMIEEAAASRVFAGVHFRSSVDAGVRMGKSVSAAVLESVAQPIATVSAERTEERELSTARPL